MKRFFYAGLALLMWGGLAFSFTACSDDDDDENSSGVINSGSCPSIDISTPTTTTGDWRPFTIAMSRSGSPTSLTGSGLGKRTKKEILKTGLLMLMPATPHKAT